MKNARVQLRILSTSPLYSAEFFETSSSVARHLANRFGLAGIQTELAPSVIYSSIPAETVLIVHNGSDELLLSVVKEQRAMGARVFISWSKPNSFNTGAGALSIAAQQAISLSDGVQAWSESTQKILGSKARFIKAGCNQSETCSQDLFVSENKISQFLLQIAPIRCESGQLEILQSLVNSEIPIVLIGTLSNDPQTVNHLRTIQRAGPTVILECATPSVVESALAASRAIFINGFADGTGELAFRAGFLGKNVVSFCHSGISELFKDRGTYIEAADSNSVRNAIQAAYYSPFEAKQKEAALGRDWDKVTTDFLNFLDISGPVAKVSAKSSSDLSHPFLNVPRLCLEGESVLESGSAAYAEEFFLYALKLEGNSSRAHCGLGKTFLARGKINEAYRCFVSAVKGDTFSLDPVVQLLGCALKLGQFEEAEKALRKYSTFDPQNSDILFAHALCLAELKRNEEAVEKAQQALKLDPTHTEAQELVKRLAPPAPTNSLDTLEGIIKAASKFRDNGKVAEATSVLESVLNLKPGDPEALRELALCYAISGKYSTAADIFEAAYSSTPHDTKVLEGLLYSNRAAGTLPRLRDMLEKSVDTNGLGLEARFTYTQCLCEMGSLTKAKQQLEILTTLAPNDRRMKNLDIAVGHKH